MLKVLGAPQSQTKYFLVKEPLDPHDTQQTSSAGITLRITTLGWHCRTEASALHAPTPTGPTYSYLLLSLRAVTSLSSLRCRRRTRQSATVPNPPLYVVPVWRADLLGRSTCVWSAPSRVSARCVRLHVRTRASRHPVHSQPALYLILRAICASLPPPRTSNHTGASPAFPTRLKLCIRARA